MILKNNISSTLKKAGKPSEWFTHRDILSHKPSERLDQVKETVEKVQQEERSFKPFQGIS